MERRSASRAGLVALVASVAAFAPAAYAAPPANDDFADAQALDGSTGRLNGSTLGGSREAGEPDHAGRAGGASVWYRWTAPVSGRIMFTTADSGFDTLLAVYTGGSLAGLTLVAANDDAGGWPTSDVSFSVTGGVEYRIAVDGFAGKQGRVVLHWARPPDNDNLADAAPLMAPSRRARGTTREATLQDGEPLHANIPGGASVWYRWTAPADGTARFSTVEAAFEALLGAYEGTDLGNLTSLAGSNPTEGDETTAVLKFRATAGHEYVIAVDGAFGDSGEFVLSWTLTAAPRNDDFSSPRRLPGIAGQSRGTNVGATSETGEPDEASTVWYRWTAPRTGSVAFTTAGSNFDTVLVVVRGLTLEDVIRANDDSPFGLASLTTFFAVAGIEYRIGVDGFAGREGRIVLSWGRVLAGGGGPNRIVGTRGSDVIRGRGGGDRILAGGGPDLVYGGSGNDRLVGGGGRDLLFGDDGDDRLDARDGVARNDVVVGGRGADVCLADRRDRRRGCG